METVKLSSKYQVVIPSPIRKTLGLKPGQKMPEYLKWHPFSGTHAPCFVMNPSVRFRASRGSSLGVCYT